MLINQTGYELLIWGWIALAFFTFIMLMFIRAPYGRHLRPGWGPSLPARTGWIIMESPSIILMTIFFGITVSRWNDIDPVAIILYGIWIAHYFHRTLIWPFRAKIQSKNMPISIALFAVLFNIINAWINAEWIFSYYSYPLSWLYSPQFIVGLVIFILGMGINISSDNILFKLRKGGEKEYTIPKKGLFRWVSCPNYFGEIVEWVGWVIATWSLAGLSFALWTIANLAPRARSNHQWYQENFSNYPKKRKRLIPGVW